MGANARERPHRPLGDGRPRQQLDRRYVNSPAVYYVYYDAHGNQVATADGDGDTVSTQTYDPWGNPGSALPSDQTTHAYVGADNKQTDSTTGLILMGARPYDPATGRFLSVDPIDGGSLNNYDYAGQDPVNDYDLTGESLCTHLFGHHVCHKIHHVARAVGKVTLGTGLIVVGGVAVVGGFFVEGACTVAEGPLGTAECLPGFVAIEGVGVGSISLGYEQIRHA
jgi:RHS repeat-associated protein